MSLSTEGANQAKMYKLYLLQEENSFSSGLEHAASLTSSDLFRKPWSVIKSVYQGINQDEGLSWTVHKDSNLTIIAFVTTPISTPQDLQSDLILSSDPKENAFRSFEFLCTEKNPVFSVNKAAVSLFHENRQRLDELKSELMQIIKTSSDNKTSSPLIVTGHALGGAVAALFTLSLLDAIDSYAKDKKDFDLRKRCPLCITFGSPLIGDQKLQKAISRSSLWYSCFLHVVSHKDPLPRFLITNHSTTAAGSYVPFGTFLLCSDVNSICHENPDTILELLVAKCLFHDQNQGLPLIDYGNIVENHHRNAICKDNTAPAGNIALSNPLHASVILQLLALGSAPHVQPQQQNIDIINALATKVEKLEAKFIYEKRTKFDPSKILNIRKIDMAELERYKKWSKNREIGYYDSYKKMILEEDHHAVGWHKNLRQYWEQTVEEAEMKPQTEGANFRKRWLFGGTNYRRMVEPLEIAAYYKEGRNKDYNKDYVNRGRSQHYIKLEEWLEKGGREASKLNITDREHVEVILTLDSLFWAHVEEALISCKQLKDAKSTATATEKEEAKKKLDGFEKYVYGLLCNYAVSPEIFLKYSSYMSWWNEYKAISETSYDSPLARFMSNPENYKQYGVGAFNF